MSCRKAFSLVVVAYLAQCTGQVPAAPGPLGLASTGQTRFDTESLKDGRLVDSGAHRPPSSETNQGQRLDAAISEGAASRAIIVDFGQPPENAGRARAALRNLSEADRKKLWPDFDGVPVVADALSTHFTSSPDEETLILYGEFPNSEGRMVVTAHQSVVTSLTIAAGRIDAAFDTPNGQWLIVSGGGTHMGETSVVAFVVGMAGGRLRMVSALGEVYHSVCGVLASPEAQLRIAGTDERRWTTISRAGEVRVPSDLKLSTVRGSCAEAGAP